MDHYKIPITIKIVTAVVFFIAAVSLFAFRDNLNFAPLSGGAVDGTWALAAVESDHLRFFESVNCLAENSLLVLRVNVISRRVEVFGRGDTEMVWEQFYVYELEIVEAYKTFSDRNNHTHGQGDVIEIMQFKGLASGGYYPPINDENKRFYFDFIQADINVGDDLVVFLVNPYLVLRNAPHYSYWNGVSPSRFAHLRHRRLPNGYVEHNAIGRRIQQGTMPTATSLFTLTNQVQAAFLYSPHENIFESVNPVNNLVLTREELKKGMSR
jgi:hypothetical protein